MQKNSCLHLFALPWPLCAALQVAFQISMHLSISFIVWPFCNDWCIQIVLYAWRACPNYHMYKTCNNQMISMIRVWFLLFSCHNDVLCVHCTWYMFPVMWSPTSACLYYYKDCHISCIRTSLYSIFFSIRTFSCYWSLHWGQLPG